MPIKLLTHTPQNFLFLIIQFFPLSKLFFLIFRKKENLNYTAYPTPKLLPSFLIFLLHVPIRLIPSLHKSSSLLPSSFTAADASVILSDRCSSFHYPSLAFWLIYVSSSFHSSYLYLTRFTLNIFFLLVYFELNSFFFFFFLKF